jgi:hypothetical protein
MVAPNFSLVNQILRNGSEVKMSTQTRVVLSPQVKPIVDEIKQVTSRKLHQ